jgi:hypothetical protein
MTRKRIFVPLLVAVCLGAGAAPAQIKAEHPRHCVMSVGPTQMMFSAFQENRTDEIFCRHVPTLGPTMIILDAQQVELRDMNIEIRLLRNTGQKDWRDDLDANTVAVLPPRKYLADKGTASFTHDFVSDGDYIALVRATSDDGAKEYVGQYHFSVGETAEWYVALALTSLVGVGAALGMWSRSRKAPRPMAGRRVGPPSAFRQSLEIAIDALCVNGEGAIGREMRLAGGDALRGLHASVSGGSDLFIDHQSALAPAMGSADRDFQKPQADHLMGGEAHLERVGEKLVHSHWTMARPLILSSEWRDSGVGRLTSWQGVRTRRENGVSVLRGTNAEVYAEL